MAALHDLATSSKHYNADCMVPVIRLGDATLSLHQSSCSRYWSTWSEMWVFLCLERGTIWLALLCVVLFNDKMKWDSPCLITWQMDQISFHLCWVVNEFWYTWANEARLKIHILMRNYGSLLAPYEWRSVWCSIDRLLYYTLILYSLRLL